MVWLVLTIVFDSLGVSMSRLSEGFTIAKWTAGVLLMAVCVLYSFSRAINVLQLGTAYAIWSGVGTVSVATIGAIFFGDKVKPQTFIGVALVVAGIVVLNLAGVRDN